MIKCHYRKSFYATDKPYRDCLVDALRHFGVVEFVGGDEFWTLGGMEWCEFEYLRRCGVKFGPGSYHNVDRGVLNENLDASVVGHSRVDFFDIDGLWLCPRAVCFDSTIGLVDSNVNDWLRLVSLGLRAVDRCGWTVLSWNFMTGYGCLSFRGELLDRYAGWLGLLVEYAESWGVGVEYYGECVWAPKDGSTTPMISGHCKLSAG